MFSLILTLGIAVGYLLGYKNEKTLKQQVHHLRQVVKKNNKSAQLKELTLAELQERNDWDFRSKLAEVTGQSVTNLNPEADEDMQSMRNVF